ncbi:MAG: arsenite efflux transporter metallochaperone ArsD [Gammaproteobacteria bacterium]|nr:arsenite efflux transporter metallochaperone ArsD [Gammaproteobacteria bacterium]
MSKLKIYEPAMCCATGICGADPDTLLIAFSADIEWLKNQGVSVERFNLAQEPAAFIADPQVKTEINAHGETCLPLLVLDDSIVCRGSYPDRAQLAALTGLESVATSVGNKAVKDQADCGCGPSCC